MNRRNLITLALMLSLLTLIPGAGYTQSPPAVVAQSALPKADSVLLARPEVKVGDTFTYQKVDGWTNKPDSTFVHQVVEVTADRIRVRNNGKTTMTFTPEWNLVAAGTYTLTPFYPANHFPVASVGQTWKGKATRNDANGDRYDYTVTSKVEGIEEVTVPAGTFKAAVKIVIETKYQAATKDGQGSGTISEVLWIAPEVPRYVKYKYENTDWSGQPYTKFRHELAKFDRG